MTDQIDLLVNEIAIKHGVVLGRDDPILILQTMNARLMEESANTQQILLSQYKEELEGIALRWGNDAKEKSERILNSSLASSKEAMANVLQESATRTTQTIQNGMEQLLNRTENLLLHTKRIALINLSASALILLAASTLVFGFIR